MPDLTLRNGTVVTPTGLVRGGLTVTDGVITSIGADPELPRGDTDLDVAGRYLLPGLIDPHVHLGIGDGAGPEKLRRDFVTESRDAAAGGVTTMITTTLFGTGSRGEAAELAIAEGDRHSTVDYRLTAVVTTREHLREAEALVSLGIRSFKFFLGYKGEQAESFGMNASGISWDFFYQACEALGAAGATAFPTIHAEDPYVRDFLTERARRRGPGRQLQTWLDEPEHPRADADLPGGADRARGRHAGVRGAHQRLAERRPDPRAEEKGWPVFGETLA